MATRPRPRRLVLMVACVTGLFVVAFNLVQLHRRVGRQPPRVPRSGGRAQNLAGTRDAGDLARQFGAGDKADEALAQVGDGDGWH